MAKLTVEELNQKYSDKIADSELLVELMEDVTDSFTNEDAEELSRLKEELESAKSELEEVKGKYDDVLNRYKERFLTAVDDVKTESSEDEEDIDVKEVIDVKEI